MRTFVRPPHRLKPLPVGDLQGRFLIAPEIFKSLHRAFARTSQVGNEGICLLAGREIDRVTLLLQVIVPESSHGPQHVMISREATSKAARAARTQELGILAQVHTHPGSDARHSDGDDKLILMPFQGMLSIVAPHYGANIRGLANLTIHQFNNGEWVLCNEDSISRGIEVIKPLLDLRP